MEAPGAAMHCPNLLRANMRSINSKLRHLIKQATAPSRKASYVIINSDFDAFIGRRRTKDSVTMQEVKDVPQALSTGSVVKDINAGNASIRDAQILTRGINSLDTDTSRRTLNAMLQG